jgi:LacI family transcriptional regulator
MHLKRTTIKDIARELNLHHSTVSRALHNDPAVKPETAKRVRAFAREMGYQVNMSALQLRGSIRNNIAVLVPNINHNFFSNIVSTLTDLAYRAGYIISVFQSNESYTLEKEIINTMIQNNVAGVIASISMGTSDSAHFRQLEKYQIPLVFFDRHCADIRTSKVTVDNISAVHEVVKLLAQKGYRRIAHLTGNPLMNVFRDRQAGYTMGIKSNQLNYERTVVIQQEFNIESGASALDMLLKEHTPPDALVCDSQFLTLGAIFKLRELKISTQKDFGLAGFSDNPYVKVIAPEVISIVQPDKAIAEASFDLIKRKIENNDQSTESRIFEATIIDQN